MNISTNYINRIIHFQEFHFGKIPIILMGNNLNQIEIYNNHLLAFLGNLIIYKCLKSIGKWVKCQLKMPMQIKLYLDHKHTH